MSRRPGLKLASLIALALAVTLAPTFAQFATRPALAATPTHVAETVMLAKGTPYETPLYVIHGTEPGPAVMVVAGVNGQQPGGVAAAQVAATYRIQSGTLLVLPEANKQAIEADVPWISGGINLQTAFPTSKTDAPNGDLASAVWSAVKQYGVDYLIDLHESGTYYTGGYTSATMGQTVLYEPTAAGTALAKSAVTAANAAATRPFTLVKSSPKGSLPRAASDYLGVTALTLRTTTTEALPQRTAQAVAGLNAVLTAAGIQFNRVEVVTVAAGTKYATDLYVFDSGVPGPTFMIVGGVHGNEPAGYGAALQFKDEVMIKAGRVLVLPQANILGDSRKSRYVEGSTDLNRLFPDSKGEVPTHPLALAIWNVIKDYRVDYLVDFHEGYDYYSNPNNSAVGQTFIYYPSAEMQALANSTVASLNKGIKDSYHQFKALRYPVPGSIARASGQFLGVKSAIIESVYPEPYAQRVGYLLQAMNHMLSTLGMK
ncbi:MAG: M99 family carboxypeptidase catalytic domain-containing protein [Chloroflexota bacterium]